MKGVGPGTVLGGRYTVHRRIAQDRGTERWTADDTTLGRQVSILVVPLEDHRTASFVDAARRASSVSHAVLVRILDVGQDDDVAFVVEEVLDDARSLGQIVTDGGIPGDEVRRITGEVAAALESARQRGMHHLDLTPDDVLRTPDGEVRLRGVEIAGIRAGEDALDPDEAARRDAVGVVALAYAGLTGLWPLGAGGSGLGPAPRVPAGVAAPSEIAAGVPRDIDAICRLTLNDDQGPTTPGDYARQVAPWPSRQVVGRPVVPAIARAEPAEPAATADTATAPDAGPVTSEEAEEAAASPSSTADDGLASTATLPVIVAGAPAAGEAPPAAEPADLTDPGEDAPAPVRPDAPSWLAAGDDPFEKTAVATAAGTAGAAAAAGSASPAAGPTVDEPPARRSWFGGAEPGVDEGLWSSDTGSADDDEWDDTAWGSGDWDDEREPRAVARADDRGVGSGSDDRDDDDHDARGQAAAAGAAVAEAFGTVSTRVSGFARRAVDKVTELSPDTERIPREFDDEAPTAMVPAEPLTRDESKLAIGIVAAFLVLALVIGIWGVMQIGSRTDLGLDGPAGTPAAGSAAPSGSPEATGGEGEGDGEGGGAAEPLAILKVEAYDPQGDGAENNSLTPKTYDGDTSTGWNSENYRTDPFGGLKKGLGLIVDLGPNKKPQEVQLDIPKNVDLEVWVGPDASLDGATKIGEKADSKGGLDFAVPDDVTGQYIIIWYTGLHPDEDGKRRAWLNEVVVTG